MIRKALAGLFLAGLFLACPLAAQGPPDGPGRPPREPRPGPPGYSQHGPPPGPMDRSVHVGPPGRWWSDPRLVQLLQLTADQQRAMDRVFDQNRAKLIDLNNSLRKEEAVLRPLVAADKIDEQKALAQIDRVANARAELEKANGRMLIELRNVLVGDQWRRLQSDEPTDRPSRPGGL